MWHQAPKGSSPSLTGGWQQRTKAAAESGVVTGRRLVPGTKDVLLGRANVPLLQLLQKSTGLCADMDLLYTILKIWHENNNVA